MEIVHTDSGYTARFTVWPDRYIQMMQVSQDIYNLMFSIPLKQQQNCLETNQTKGILYGRSKATIGLDAATS
jgi:hypothetical protein